jgi:hypothetical protein
MRQFFVTPMVSRLAKSLFRIQYVSDLHLEFYEKLTFPCLLRPVAPYLALAGDIGQPRHPLFAEFLDYASKRWEKVFYVAGNHEYYTTPDKKDCMFAIQATIQDQVNKHPNVHFLHHDNPSYYLYKENVAIIGSTLWSYIPPALQIRAASGMNDYQKIYVGDQLLTPDMSTELHTKERSNLKAHIDYWGSQQAQVCVLTHHMPSFDLISSRYKDNLLNACFASSCEDLMKPHVRAWIYGHTHNASSGVLDSTHVVSNAHGYPHERVPGFSAEAWLEFPIRAATESAMLADLAAAAAGIRPPLPPTASLTKEEEVEFC